MNGEREREKVEDRKKERYKRLERPGGKIEVEMSGNERRRKRREIEREEAEETLDGEREKVKDRKRYKD